jgi:hypothetical protein
LDTQVGSTIPQSDQERRGDELYRQGQLPLALGAWKQAWEKGARHAGLKAKIDLSDRDLRKEIFEAAADECAARIADGEFSVAVERAYTALDAALDDAQRAKAQKLLQTAKNGEAQRARKRLLSATFVMLFAVVAVVVFVVFIRDNREAPENAEKTNATGAPNVIRTAGKPSFVIAQLNKIGATTTLPSSWAEDEFADDDALYAWTFAEQQFAPGVRVKISAHEPEEEQFDVCLQQLSEDPGLPEAKLKGANPNFFKINERHRVAQLEFECPAESDEDEPNVCALFVLETPEKKIYRVSFFGAQKALKHDDVKKQIVAFFRQFRWREE